MQYSTTVQTIMKRRYNEYTPLIAGNLTECSPEGPALINPVVGGNSKMLNPPLNTLLENERPESDELRGELFINFPANNLMLNWFHQESLVLQAVPQEDPLSMYGFKAGVLPSVKDLR